VKPEFSESHPSLVAYKKNLVQALLNSNELVQEQVRLESRFKALEEGDKRVYLRSKRLSELQAEVIASGIIRCLRYGIELPNLKLTEVDNYADFARQR
jgi:hypothetical protein